MENLQPLIIGKPGKITPVSVTNVYKGENWGFPIAIRDYQDNVIPDPQNYNVYAAFANIAGESDPFLVFEIGDPQVSLEDPAAAVFKFSFKKSDMKIVPEGQSVTIDVWAEPLDPAIEASTLQARLSLTLKASIEKKHNPTPPPPTSGIGAMAIGTTFEVAA